MPKTHADGRATYAEDIAATPAPDAGPAAETPADAPNVSAVGGELTFGGDAEVVKGKPADKPTDKHTTKRKTE